ncbi:MAG TPA: hypothetical protein PKA42_02505 [Candidatus Paceibacterota bacterium]|nr:hypothetical protein [Candidatus Paceibacterota bacterium]HMO83015.1 hypothetical protein [Candidatus Paceibacterota bacterium]
MQPKTFLVDFAPTVWKETPAQLRRKQYVDDLLKIYDLGEVVFCSHAECLERGVTENPDVIICCYEYFAREIKDKIPEAVLYVTEGVSGVFSRKAEVEEKMKSNKKIFEDAADTVKRIREASPEERDQMRKFHALSYDELYKMIQQAIIGDNEDLRKKAWDLLWGPGEKNSAIIWMRVQMMAEVWEGSKGDRLEQLMLMSMGRHLDLGLVRKMDTFTDADGQQYHQYMFLDPYGNDFNYIRRLPFGTKDQDRYTYEALLKKNEIPINYMRLQMEAVQFRKEINEYLQAQCEQISSVLDKWKENPELGRKELGVGSKPEHEDLALSKDDVNYLQEKLRQIHDRLSLDE